MLDPFNHSLAPTVGARSFPHAGGGGAAAAAGDGSAVDCLVCLAPVQLDDPAAYMVTPCDHLFHTPCLATWLQSKLECPTCRLVLPEERSRLLEGAEAVVGDDAESQV